MKRILFFAAAIVMGTAVCLPAQARTQVGLNIVIGNPPPPMRHEFVPAPRRGYEWAPGYWDWSGHHHVWRRGHWERQRSGQQYFHPQWQQTDHGWQLDRGGWKHAGHRELPHEQSSDGALKRMDRDHDGVPNRMDNHPDNPHRN